MAAALTTNAQKTVSFAFLTDLHVSPGIPSEANLKEIVQEINTQQFDFVVVTGDLTNTGANAELQAAYNILNGLQFKKYVIPGNHETNWSESATQKFNELFGNDRFYFEYDKFQFVGFNTGPYMKMGDGHVKEEDIHWLKKLLAEKKDPNKTLISLAHYPLGDGLDNWTDATKILNQYNTRLHLCGHGHRLSLHNFDGIPGIMGRSSLIGSGYEKPGYNIVTLRNDSVLIYQKNLGEAAPQLFKQFSLKNNNIVQTVKIAPKPDYSINNRFKNVNVKYQFQDTASIFTGVVNMTSNSIAYGNSDGELVALEVPSKKVMWRKKHNGSFYATPVYAQGILMYGTVDGHLYGVEAKSGKQLWTLNVDEPVIADGIVDNNNVYIGVGSKKFYSINILTGKINWKSEVAEGQMQGKPAFNNDVVVFGAWDRHLYCLNKATGKLLWKWNNGSPQKLYSPGNVVPFIANDRVFIVAPDRYMTAIDVKTGQTIWRNNQYTVREAMCGSADGKLVYAKLMNDKVIAVSTTSSVFELMWMVDAQFGYEHNPCPLLESNGMLYTGTKNGLLVAIDTKTQTVAWQHKPGNAEINKITADANGNIWISMIEGKILQFQANK